MKRVFLMLILILTARLADCQDLGNLKGQDPFQVSGLIGTSNTFYSSNRNITNRDPIANHVFANLNLSIYGVDVPFAFYYTNRNLAFSHPFINFGISPRYKSVKVHLGYRSMRFSSLSYSGLTFLGGGLEVNNKWVRLGFFKGTLKQANAEDLQDQNSRNPSYKRSAYGVKVGVGNNKNNFDLILFSAKDDTNSIPRPQQYTMISQENVVFGSNFKITPFRNFSLSSEVGACAYNYRMSSSEIQGEDVSLFSKFFVPRYNTAIRYAGVFKANLSVKQWNTSLFYKYIQPDYVSLGTPYMANNYRSLNWNFSSNFLKNMLIFNAMAGFQRDNITKRQLYTNLVYNYSGNLIIRFNKNLSLRNSYTGYRMQQLDGTLPVSDTFRLNRIMHNFAISPAYVLVDGKNSHNISLTYNYATTINLNKLRMDFSDFTMHSAGAAYSYHIKEPGVNITGNYTYQTSEAETYQFRSHTIGAGVEKKFLKEKNLGVQLNGNIGMTSVSTISSNTLINLQAGSSYTYEKKHTLSLRLGFNYSKNRQNSGLYLITGTEFISTLNYTYRFMPLKKNTKGK